MNFSSYKSKEIWGTILKVLIIALAITVLVSSFKDKTAGDWKSFVEKVNNHFSYSVLLGLLVLAFFNRFLEVLKWQLLANHIQPTNLWQATKQVMSAIAFAVITPNGIGEYAAKTIFFKKIFAKKVVFYNFVCNGMQMICTILFGIVGLWMLHFKMVVGIILMVIVLFLLVYVLIKNFKVKGYTLASLVQKWKQVPSNIQQKVFGLSVGRYVFFSHQYVMIFYVLGSTTVYPELMAAIAAMYFISSSLPSFQFLDFLVKGSVGIFIFGKIEIPESEVLFASLIIWLYNVVLPISVGLIGIVGLKIPSRS
ncbi:MAG: hypothetical protein ACK4JX_00740 [Flavobacterium sp.]